MHRVVIQLMHTARSAVLNAIITYRPILQRKCRRGSTSSNPQQRSFNGSCADFHIGLHKGSIADSNTFKALAEYFLKTQNNSLHTVNYVEIKCLHSRKCTFIVIFWNRVSSTLRKQ